MSVYLPWIFLAGFEHRHLALRDTHNYLSHNAGNWLAILRASVSDWVRYTNYLTLSVGWQYSDDIPLQKGKTPHLQKGCPVYDTKLHLGVRLQFWRSEECCVPLYIHYSHVHSGGGLVGPIRMQSMRQIELFASYLSLIWTLNII